MASYSIKIKSKYIWIVGVILIIGMGFVIFNSGEVESKTPIIIYKSASCGCCVGYSSVLNNNNYDVNLISEEDMNSIKYRYNIPREMQSCHTAVIEGYFVEGHVPLEAVNKLLSERPDIDGIALPNMPAGSPGMPGIKQGEFIIYSLKNGVYSEFMRI